MKLSKVNTDLSSSVNHFDERQWPPSGDGPSLVHVFYGTSQKETRGHKMLWVPTGKAAVPCAA